MPPFQVTLLERGIKLYAVFATPHLVLVKKSVQEMRRNKEKWRRKKKMEQSTEGGKTTNFYPHTLIILLQAVTFPFFPSSVDRMVRVWREKKN